MQLQRRLAKLEQRYGKARREPMIILTSLVSPGRDGPGRSMLAHGTVSYGGTCEYFTREEDETEEAFENRVHHAASAMVASDRQ